MAALRSFGQRGPVANLRWLEHSTTSFRAPSRYWKRSFSSCPRYLTKKYTESHEWVDVTGDGKTAFIGITSYAAAAMGDIVFVESPEVGREVEKGDVIGAIESVKSASDILAPISGNIVSVNEALSDNPAFLGNEPEGQGWLAKLKISDSSSIDSLMDEMAYEKFSKDCDGSE